MERAARGAILNLSSLAAYQPAPISATYGATKAFVHSFTHAVHEEARGTGVHVHAGVPGLHPHRVPRPRRARRRPTLPEFLWQSADQVVAAALARSRPRPVGLDPGALNQAAAAFSSVAPAGDHARASPAWSSSDRGEHASSGTNAMLLEPRTAKSSRSTS